MTRILQSITLLTFVLGTIRPLVAEDPSSHASSERTRIQHKSATSRLMSEQESLLREAYLWGWPMVYLHNVRNSLRLVSKPGVSGGAPVAPINRLSMLTKPVGSEFVSVPCPNPDLVYGFAMLDLSEQPVVLQIPEARDRFWMFQLGDQRTDSFANIGSIYNTPPGFYLIASHSWKGEAPEGIVDVLRSPTDLAYILPRYLYRPEASDELQHVLNLVSVYPLSHYTGRWKQHDWTKPKWYPAIGESNRHRSKSVRPESFFDDLRAVLREVPPLIGEEYFYQKLNALLDRIAEDSVLTTELQEKAVSYESEIMEPLFDFRNVGQTGPTRWTSVENGACFGDDYFSRAAVAKSNIFVNRPQEAKYFHLEVDETGQELLGERAYTIRLRPEDLPPNNGFWSLTIYDANHRLTGVNQEMLSVNATNEGLLRESNGTLTIAIQKERPCNHQPKNWLRAPDGRFSLYLRVYGPTESVVNGQWCPPTIARDPEVSRLVSASSSGAARYKVQSQSNTNRMD